MPSTNISTVDLNLLHVLSVVLEERSATRAAKRLHVTQSAVSNALRRAREVFDDPLVTRKAHGLEPTARALALLPALRAWVDGAEQLLSPAPNFDPASSTRTFRIAGTDAVAITLLTPILRLLTATAPHARLQVTTLDRLLAEDGLARGSIDLLIGRPPTLERDQRAELVYRDPMESILRSDHPRVRSRLSLETYASLPHVDLALFDTVDDEIDRALSKLGYSRTVKVALPHFSSIPLVVAETDCVATVSRRLARSFAKRLPLRTFKPPLPLSPIEVRQVWHRRYEGDGAVQFLRHIVRKAAKQ